MFYQWLVIKINWIRDTSALMINLIIIYNKIIKQLIFWIFIYILYCIFYFILFRKKKSKNRAKLNFEKKIYIIEKKFFFMIDTNHTN